MGIEEYFRDASRQDGLRQSKRNGFAIRLTLIKNSERLGRFLSILAAVRHLDELAYILLVMIRQGNALAALTRSQARKTY